MTTTSSAENGHDVGGLSLTLNYPSGSAGDVLLVWLSSDNSATPTPSGDLSSGEQLTVVSSTGRLRVYRRVRQSGDISVTWTVPSSARLHAIAANIPAGMDGSAPTTTPFPTPPITPSAHPVGPGLLDHVNVLDTATVPNPSGTTSSVECIAVTRSEDEAGNEILTPEFGDVVLTAEERRKRQADRGNLGSLGGRVIVPPSVGDMPQRSPQGPGGGQFTPPVATRNMPFDRDAAVTGSTSKPWNAVTSGVVYELAVEMEAQGSAVDVVLNKNGTPVATMTVPAGKTTWAQGGLHVPVAKDIDKLTITCTDTGFDLVVTVRIM